MHPQFLEASITFGATTCMAVYVASRAERTDLHALIVGLMGAMMLWTGAVAASRLLVTPAYAHAAALLAFIGIFGVPPLFALLAAQVTRSRLLENRPWLLVATVVPSILFTLALATNESHHLLVRTPSQILEPGTAWAGPLYWVWAPWGFLLVLAGVGLYVRRAVRLISRKELSHGLLLAAIVLAPTAASLLHNMGVGDAVYDRTPLLMGISVGLLFWVDWRYRLEEMVPVARRDVIEQLVDGVIVAGADGRILDMNPAAVVMVAAPLSELRGRKLVDVIAQQAVDRAEIDDAGFQRVIAAVLETGNEFGIQIETFLGQTYEVRISGVRGRHGDTDGVYMILREVTEQVRLAAMMRQNHRLETVASLAAGIAHEVNNPLAFVRANLSHVHRATLELAEPDKFGSEYGKSEELDELRLVVEESIEGVDRIGRIIERVRRFSHIQEGELERVDIRSLIEDAVRIARLARFDGVEVELSIEAGLPECEASVEGLSQVLTNLIVNAAQSLQPTGGRIDIAVCGLGQFLEVRVADNGPGVPAALRSRIFDPFFTTKKPGEGTGLGLAVAFGIAREHGGSLALESPEEGGAVFTLRLPVANSAAANA